MRSWMGPLEWFVVRRRTPEPRELAWGEPGRFEPALFVHTPISAFGSWRGFFAAMSKVSPWRMVVDPAHRETYPWFRRMSAMTHVGTRAPDFVLPTVDGERLRLPDLGGRIAVFMFAAMTCPPARAQLPRWNELHRAYAGRDVVVFVIYSRERHPGEPGYRGFRHTRTPGEKLANARLFAEMAEMPVLVDGIREEVLTKYGKVPNAAFVVDRNGAIAYKSTWADADAVRVVVERLLTVEPPVTDPGDSRSSGALTTFRPGWRSNGSRRARL